MINLATASADEIEHFFETVAAGIAVFDVAEHGILTMVCSNSVYRSMHQMDQTPQIGETVHTFLPRYVVKHYREQFTTCIEEQSPVDAEMAVDIAGIPHWYRLRMVPVYSGEPAVMTRIFTTSIDVTQQRQLEQELDNMNSRLKAIVDSTYDAIISIDNKHRIKTFNLAAEALFCYDRNEVIGHPIDRLIPERSRMDHARYVDAFGDSPVMSRPMEVRAEVSGLRSDGTEFPAEVAIAKIRVLGNTEYTAIVRDISVQLRLQEELRLRANTDPLTGLANRRYLWEIADIEIDRGRRYAHQITLLTLDIDNFKAINDRFGHAVGDEVIKAVGRILKAQGRSTDTAARIGGEELCMLMPETSLEGAIIAAERVRKAVRAMHQSISGLDDLVVTASIGVSEFRPDDAGFDQLLARADQAMYKAKASGKDRVVIDDHS